MAVNLRELFDKHEDEYLKFERVENRLSNRPDLHAFLLLDALLPNAGYYMISGAEYEEVFLETPCEKLAEIVTEEQIITLLRCGVRYSIDYESLSMFV